MGLTTSVLSEGSDGDSVRSVTPHVGDVDEGGVGLRKRGKSQRASKTSHVEASPAHLERDAIILVVDVPVLDSHVVRSVDVCGNVRGEPVKL